MKRVRGKTTERASKRSNPNKRKDGSRGTPPRNGGAAGQRSGTFSLYNSQRDLSKDSYCSLLSQQSRASKATRYNDGLRAAGRRSSRLDHGTLATDEEPEEVVETLLEL